jgi:urease accessory protein
MLIGGVLGMTGVALPAVESGILASVVVLGLLVLTAARVPVALSAAMVGVFAVLHGHAHGAELPALASAISYSTGFALATALLHAAGLGLAFLAARDAGRLLVRGAGGLIAACGVALAVI